MSNHLHTNVSKQRLSRRKDVGLFLRQEKKKALKAYEGKFDAECYIKRKRRWPKHKTYHEGLDAWDVDAHLAVNARAFDAHDDSEIRRQPRCICIILKKKRRRRRNIKLVMSFQPWLLFLKSGRSRRHMNRYDTHIVQRKASAVMMTRFLSFSSRSSDSLERKRMRRKCFLCVIVPGHHPSHHNFRSFSLTCEMNGRRRRRRRRWRRPWDGWIAHRERKKERRNVPFWEQQSAQRSLPGRRRTYRMMACWSSKKPRFTFGPCRPLSSNALIIAP